MKASASQPASALASPPAAESKPGRSAWPLWLACTTFVLWLGYLAFVAWKVKQVVEP